MSTVTSPPSPRKTDPTAASTAHPPRIRAWWLRLIVTVLICLAMMMIGGGVFNWLTSFKQEPPRQNTEGIAKTYSVSVYQVQPFDLQRVITAFGTAVADREVIVAAEVAGQVVEANRLEVGRSVEPPAVNTVIGGTTSSIPGDLLVRIDPQTYQERVLQARKLLAQDDVELQRLAQEHQNNRRLLETERKNEQTAAREHQSALELLERKVGTESAVRQAELEMRRYEDAVNRLENELSLYDVRRRAVEARKDAHQSDLELAQLDLRRTQVRPPFAGVISEVHVEQGQYVRPGDELIRLTDPERVEIPLSLTLSDYLDIATLRESGAAIRVALAENETGVPRWFSDPLDELRQAPEADQRTRTVRIFTEVNNQQQSVPLLPGTFVHARIPGPIMPGAVVIPREAVVEGTVFVAVPVASTGDDLTQPDTTWLARVERRPVTLDRTLQSLVLLRDGLAGGEWIVTTNLDVIFDGAQLQINRHEGQRTLPDELAELRTPQVQIVEPASNR